MSEKVLYIEIFQPFAQFRNPFTFYYAQTYPLPPKSTIIGMLQNSVGDWYGNTFGLDNWWNLKISINGGFESFYWNYQNLIKGQTELKFDNEGILRLLNQNLPLYGFGIKSQRTPVYQQELFNGHLYIFIKGDGDFVEKLRESLIRTSKVLYLGRSEDIIYIRKIKVISDSEEKVNVSGDIKLKFPTYIIKDNFPIKNKKFPVYSIPTKVIFKNKVGNEFQIVKHKREINKETERETEFKTVIYTGYDYSIILDEGKFINIELFKIEDNKFIILEEFGWL